MDDLPSPATPTIKHALSAIAETSIDQARDLVVAQLDRWAERVRQRLIAPEAELAEATEPQHSASLGTPVLIGALAGATVAWLLTRPATKT